MAVWAFRYLNVYNKLFLVYIQQPNLQISNLLNLNHQQVKSHKKSTAI